MKMSANYLRWSIAATFVLIIFAALVAWTNGPQNPSINSHSAQDTVPKRPKVTRESGDRELDKELRQLEEAKARLEELSEKDWEKMKREIDESLKKIDLEKIQLQAEKALSKIDFDKISKDVEESLRKIDLDKIERDVQKALDEVSSKVDKEKITKELQEARKEIEEVMRKKEWRKDLEEVKKINMKEIEEEMIKAKKELERIKDDMKLEKLNMKDELNKARAEIDRAKEELKSYQEMIYEMEKDGLISTKEDYTIEYNKGELLINGKKQSTEVGNKYKKYFRKDKMTIKKKDGDFNIDID